jgi:hypothetical protein
MLTYSANLVIITFGTHIVTGYAEDSFINLEKDGDGVTRYVGADGEVARSMSLNKCYNITLTLSGASPTNDYLMNLWNKDQQRGDGIEPITVKDLAGGRLFNANECWIVNPPAYNPGATLPDMEWTLNTGKADYVSENIA